jgi:hypothetical protein
MKSVKSRRRERERERERESENRSSSPCTASYTTGRRNGNGRTQLRELWQVSPPLSLCIHWTLCALASKVSKERDFVVVVPLLQHKSTQNEETAYSTLNPTTKNEASQIFLLLLLLHVGILEGLE